MADTYEKDLAQKTSLTTSDYIRVVGSDNVSYKQLVSALGTTLNNSYPFVQYSVSSGGFTALDTTQDAVTTIQMYLASVSGTEDAPSASFNKWAVIGFRNAANTYAFQLAISFDSDNTIYKRRKANSSTWGAWTKMPTRAELTPTSESLTAGTDITFASNFNNTATKVGSVVTVEFALTSSGAIANGAQIATVPSGYRPTKQVRGICYFTDGYARYAIEPSGKVTTYTAIASGKSVIGTITYIV